MAFCRYCGVSGYLYHRKTFLKEWRCRGCGYEFSQAEFEVFAEQLKA
jgi:ribosomal protein L37AE/L43A